MQPPPVLPPPPPLQRLAVGQRVVRLLLRP
jgi:hypothetical protein